MIGLAAILGVQSAVIIPPMRDSAARRRLSFERRETMTAVLVAR